MQTNTINIDGKWSKEDLISYIQTCVDKWKEHNASAFIEPYEDEKRIIWGDFHHICIEKSEENEVKIEIEGKICLEYNKSNNCFIIPKDMGNISLYLDVEKFFTGLSQLVTKDFKVATLIWDQGDDSKGVIYTRMQNGNINYIYIPKYDWSKVDLFWEIVKKRGIEIKRQGNDEDYDNDTLKEIYDLKWGIIGSEIERMLYDDITVLSPDWFRD